MLALLVKYIFPLWHKIFRGVLNVVGDNGPSIIRVTVVNVKVHSNEENIVRFPSQKQSTKGKGSHTYKSDSHAIIYILAFLILLTYICH
jgi:hypothetical protein